MVRHPAVTKVFGVHCIVRDSRSGCSNDFKCTPELHHRRYLQLHYRMGSVTIVPSTYVEVTCGHFQLTILQDIFTRERI